MKTPATSRRNTFLGLLCAFFGITTKLGAKSPEPKYIRHKWRQLGDKEILQIGDVWASKDPNDIQSGSGDDWSPGLTIQPVHPKQWETPARARHGSGTCWRPTGSVPVFE
jgi:hypothetical protein